MIEAIYNSNLFCIAKTWILKWERKREREGEREREEERESRKTNRFVDFDILLLQLQ
jgi:membrane protein insertase Oxa1/YidC/SpoIIIJ